jgi:hypothetical protein
MYCIFLGKARETVTVPTITRDKLNLISDGSNPSLIAKGTSGVSEGYIQLNCAENSHGVKIKSPPHSAGQSYTLTLPQSITNNTFLKTDGSGNLSFAAAGGTMTPAFFAKKNATQSTGNNAFTKITYETEDVDTDGAFASSRFTVPSGKAGKYFVGFNKMNNKGGSTAEDYTMIYKNGSSIGNFPHFGGASPTIMKSQQIIIDLAVADYLEVYHYGTTTNSSAGSLLDGVRNSFYGYKIIE